MFHIEQAFCKNSVHQPYGENPNLWIDKYVEMGSSDKRPCFGSPIAYSLHTCVCNDSLSHKEEDKEEEDKEEEDQEEEGQECICSDKSVPTGSIDISLCLDTQTENSLHIG